MSTSTHLPLCVYCGTARPADESRCPQCGRPWIDVRVGALGSAPRHSKVPAMVGAAASGATVVPPEAATSTDVTAVPQDPPLPPLAVEEASGPSVDDEPPVPPEEDVGDGDSAPDPSQRFVWLIPALIAGAAVIVVALFGFGVLDGETEPEAAAAPTVAATATTAPSTTTTTQAPTTTAAPTSTTTTTTIPDPADIPPVGNPISMSSLTLKAGGIGPVVFGDEALDAIGRLVASIGRPEEMGIADETLGLCPGDDGRFVRWAGLTAIVSGALEDGAFVGYRYEEEAVPIMHLDLATPSGLRLGDPVSLLNETYAAYRIDYVSDSGANFFQLSDADGLLLWGPVSSIEDSGRVEGINSPDPCGSLGR